ncbi:hypothetical protein JCM11641_008265 [Rhodosporidiobolus odoratus]
MSTSTTSDPLPSPALPSSTLYPSDLSPAAPLMGNHLDSAASSAKGKEQATDDGLAPSRYDAVVEASQRAKKTEGWLDLRGAAAGTASGITKLIVGHPFDVVKVRLQCSPQGTYAGPLDALKKTVGREGPRALYKGATPPAFGWTISDAMLMGSLHQYRVIISRWESSARSGWRDDGSGLRKDGKSEPLGLSLGGHFLAGLLAGQTVCFVAAPTEHLKARLQMQTVGTKSYTGPIDCAKKIIQAKGVRGLWHGLGGTLVFRSNMGSMFLGYELNLRFLKKYAPDLNKGTANFLAGGMASNIFWTLAFPADAVKNRFMTDSLTNPKYPNYMSCIRSIMAEGGVKAFYRGFLPAILRAFPTNASALYVWEGVMRSMGTPALEAVD